MEPLVISVAPNGARKTQREFPQVPITPEEIAAEALRCCEAGASVLHLHVRDAQQTHSLSKAHYLAAIEAVRAVVGDRLLIQITTEAVDMFSSSEQMAIVRALKPESASIALRELAPDVAAESTAINFFQEMLEQGTIPQVILYNAEEVVRWQALRARGVISAAAVPVLFVLGRYAKNQTSQPTDVLPFLHAYENNSAWSLCAFGAQEHACATAAVALGGHARVGFENNLYLKDGSFATHNAQLVAQVRAASELIGRPIADADYVRATWGSKRQ